MSIPIFDESDFMNMSPNGDYYLANDIALLPNDMYTQVFTGTFDGRNNRITVAINSNATNVGLFSQVGSGAKIHDLIVDGQITGGINSQNVGGIAGEVSVCEIAYCTNLAEVTGLSSTSSVGGIVGSIIDFAILGGCSNNGTITGGQYVGGIIGKSVNTAESIKYCRNAGTIQGNKNNVALDGGRYIAGIVAYISDATNFHDHTNIGKILGSDFNYAGGIAGYLGNCYVAASCNSGIVADAKNYVGGIVGYLSNASLEGCINTNWIDSGTAVAGAIVGYNNGTLTNNYFDEQMCIVNGIGNNPNSSVPNQAEGRPTVSMLGNILEPLLKPNGVGFGPGYNWVFANNLYPRLGEPAPITYYDHPIALLSAAPIYLKEIPPPMEKLDDVSTDFYVSNYNTNPPFLPPPPITPPYYYQWGWYPGGVFTPSSQMGYISVPNTPPPYLNNAIINGTGVGQDALAVRLTTDLIYEKIIPINVR